MGVGEGFRVWLYYPEVWGDNASRRRIASITSATGSVIFLSLCMLSRITSKTLFMQPFVLARLYMYFSFIQRLKVILEGIDQTWDEHITAWKSRPW